MDLKYLREKGVRLLLGIVLCVMLILVDGMGWIRPVYSAVNYVVEPIEFWIGRTTTGVGNLLGTILEIGNLRHENSELRVENAKLNSDIANLGELQKENETLRTQLSMNLPTEWELVMVRVLGIDREGLSGHIIIDAGSDEGLESGQVVILGKLLVGEVRDVYETTSRVRLVSSPNSNIVAMDQETGAKGLVHGSLDGIVLEDVLENEQLNNGDTVMVWSDKMPSGLMIGRITSIDSQPTAATLRAVIDPGVSLEDIDILFVVKSY